MAPFCRQAAAPKARVIKKGLKNKKPSALSALKASIKLKPKPKPNVSPTPVQETPCRPLHPPLLVAMVGWA